MDMKECTLGELVVFQRGHDLPKTAMTAGPYPVVGSNGIIGYHSDFTTEAPSITIGRSGNVGSPFIVYGRSWSHNTSLYIKEFRDTDPIFIYYFLKTLDLAHYAGGSAVPTLNRNHIHPITVVVPAKKSDQEKIGYVLKSLDDKIKCNEEINDNLAQQALAVFLHMFANNESVTPAAIADVALNVTDGVHNTVRDDPKGDYLLLSCKNIKGGSLSIGASERRISSGTFEKLRRRTKLAKGDVLISSVGTVGELLLLNTDPTDFEFQRSVAIVKPNPTIVSSTYLYESLVSQKAELINTAHGAVQQCLFISDIASFPIGIPIPEDLQSFNEIVDPMFNRITANEAESKRLAAIRDILLPRLMSGDLNVSDLDL